MKVCKRCTLNDSMFSVKINEDGVCNYCLQSSNVKSDNDIQRVDEKYNQLLEMFEIYKDLPYQVLLAYSGGKDSTYALYLLRRKYNLSVLTLTFDNGFITEQCKRNIHNVTAELEVDNIIVKPSFSNLAKVFNLAGNKELFPPKTLERASCICTACIGMVKSSVYKEAMIRNIPFISFGWTPGQVNLKASIMKLDYRMLVANQKQIKEPIIRELGSKFEKYFINEQWIESNKDAIPSMFYPLVFSEYNENKIISTIESIGWSQPKDTDMNSTNCLLNSFANDIHIKKYGYNPYTLEIAELVRQGVLDRDEGLKKIENFGNERIVEYIKDELAKYE